MVSFKIGDDMLRFISRFLSALFLAGAFLFFSNQSCGGEEVAIKEIQKQLAAITQVVLELRNKVIVLEEEINKKNNQSGLHNPQIQEIPANHLTKGWRALRRGLGFTGVRDLLGEPESISGGLVTIWSYKNFGSVTFYEDKVSGWREPTK